MNKVMDRLYIGSVLLGDTKIEALRSLGDEITIINMAKERDIYLGDADAEGIDIFKFDMEDYHFPLDYMDSHLRKRKEQVKLAARALRLLIDKMNDGRTVLVCCSAGASRSAIMCVMYLHYTGLSWEDSIQKMLDVRTQAQEYNRGLFTLIKEGLTRK